MVGGIKTRALEHDPHRLVNFLQGLLRAFRTASERGVAEFLLLIELDTAVGATVGIDRHNSTSVHRLNGNPKRWITDRRL